VLTDKVVTGDRRAQHGFEVDMSRASFVSEADFNQAYDAWLAESSANAVNGWPSRPNKAGSRSSRKPELVRHGCICPEFGTI
jgi:hypothetical protein